MTFYQLNVLFQNSDMSDRVKLDWTRSTKTIMTGIEESLHREMFQDTMVICRDGIVSHNKLTLGLLLPELATVSVFCLPVEHTILLPDYSLAELQSRIAEIFSVVKLSPGANIGIGKKESVAGGMSSKPECLFGSSCFSRNPDHFQRYHHAHLAALAATPEQDWGPAASEQLRAQVRVHRMVEGEVALAAERRLAGDTRDTVTFSRKRRRSEEGAGQNSGTENKMKGELKEEL